MKNDKFVGAPTAPEEPCSRRRAARRFTLRVPSAEEACIIGGTNEAASEQGMPPTILVADDDELLLALLNHRLSAKGYRVRAVEDGAQALDSARSDPPDAIVLDAMMPVMDGFAALQRLKADPELANIPVIMLTALRGESDIVAALEAGAADYLVKPFLAEELISRLGRLLKTERRA